MIQMQRTYYPDGSIESEATLVDGLPDGVVRRWHLNGVLASELPVKRGNPEGIGRQWNEKGGLLGSFEIRDGTGIQRIWYPNGPLLGEISLVNGKFTGRQRAYLEDGVQAAETYWLENEKVSRKEYLEACKRNPKLPQYEAEKAPRRPKAKRSLTDTLPAMVSSNDVAPKLLQGPEVREALAWLQESREPSRSLGEATGQDDSIRLVKQLYSLGAVAVYAVAIDGAPTEDQNTGRLVIELPRDQEKRGKLLKFYGKLASELSFDPEPDVGQRYLLLVLD